MATRDVNSQLTLLELARRMDPQGDAAIIAEVLHNTNEVWMDIPWMMANGTTFHRVTRRTSLPSGTFRKVGDGVAKESSTTETVDESMALLESYSIADKWIIDNSADPAKARMDEAAAFIEGMGQTFVKCLFNTASGTHYGDSATYESRFNGLPVRMGTAGTYVIDAGGGGNDCTSIYIVQWGPNKVFCVYPKGSPNVGITHSDLGEDRVDGITSSTYYQAYVDHFKIEGGLVVKDPRCIARIGSIETSGSSNIFNEDDLITVLNEMPNAGAGSTIYVNKTIRTQMEIALKDKNNVNYTAEDGEGLAGGRVLRFRGNPVRLVEEIGNTEAAI